MTDSIYIVQISFIGYQVLSTKITSNYDLSVDSIVSEKNTLLNSQPSASAASSGAACHVFRFMDFSTIYHLSIYLPIYPSINLSIIYLSTYLSIHPSICLSIYPSIHPSIHPSIYLSLCIEIYICIAYVLCMSVCFKTKNSTQLSSSWPLHLLAPLLPARPLELADNPPT